jgi:hypothetical protein
MVASLDQVDALPVCRVCGCNDSMACTWFEVLGNGETVQRACSWVAEDLCSECVDMAPVPLLYDAAGRPVAFRERPGRQ